MALSLILGESCYKNGYSDIRKLILAVAIFLFLYCRNGHYYLRLTINQKQLRLSLKIDSLDLLAVHIRSQLRVLTDPCVEDRECLGRWFLDASATNPNFLRINAIDGQYL
jgi:hypothetical protein